MKVWGMALALLTALVLAAVPAAATASPGRSVSGPGRHAVMRFRGSNGYRFEVGVSSGKSKLLPRVSVFADKGPARVSYLAHGSLDADGRITAHLPHVGRIAVEFHPAEVGHRRLPSNCQGRPSVVERGYFRGKIELRGEQGYTTVERGGARGRIVQSFRRACDNETTPREPRHHGKHAPQQESGVTLLIAGEKGASANFDAISIKLGSKSTVTGFTASASRFREGMAVQSTVSARGDDGDLVLPKPGEAKLAEVSPPAPFDGTATFKLTSRKKSTWEGDLAVELPAFGHLTLAGPGFYSALCEGSHCTHTTPFDFGAFAGLFVQIIS